MKFNIGIIGVGGRGRSWARFIKKTKNCEGHTLNLIAISDRNEIALSRAAETYGCESYGDYHAMLEKGNLDFVIIATPHYLHTPMTVAAAEHGVNVLTEKPMCINVKQAIDMKNAVEKHNIKCAVGFQRRFNSVYVGLKNVIQSGDLGDIFQLNMIYHWWRKEDYFLNSSPVPENQDKDWEGWRGHWETEGGSALTNQLVHFIDIFQWLSPSPVKSVMAASRVHKHTFINTDDNTNAVIEFENGSTGLMQCGIAYQHEKEETFAVYGTEGAVKTQKNLKGFLGLPKFYQDYRKLALRKKKKMLSYMPKTLKATDYYLMGNFLEAIEKDDASLISVDVNEGRKSVELVRAILLSQKYEKKITYPFEDKPNEFPDLMHTYVDPEFKDMV